MEGARLLGLEVSPARWRWFRWRTLVLLLTVACGLTGFLAGVGVSERPEVVDAGLPAKLYYTLGLFIFGGMDLGTPIGGPAWGRAIMWVAYFVAPAITASAVIEAVLRMINADDLLLRRMRGHVVIAGCGRLTTLYLRRLRAVEPTMPVVVVGHPDEGAVFDELRDLYRAQVLEGDITSPAVLHRLRLGYAARVLLLSDDDFVNLDAASRILTIAPSVADHVIVHVGDLRFMRSMATTRLANRCQVFNGHQIAASHLVHAHLLDHFKRTEPLDMVVLAGFGRFGQTVLDELQAGAAGAFDHVVIVDLECTRRAGVFDEQVGFGADYHREVVDGDLRDPDVWHDVEQRVDLHGKEPVFVVGSGNDRTNLRMALRLASRYPQAFVIARSDRQWAFAEEFSREAGIHVFSVAELVAESMPEAWFGPRTDAAVPIEPAASTMAMRRAALEAESGSHRAVERSA